MARIAISLGTNVGDRLCNLRRAVNALEDEFEVESVSKVYETSPMYLEAQPDFYNAALLAKAEIGPLRLLTLVKSIERKLGRTPGARFGPREIDIDLVTYGAATYEYRVEEEVILSLPHPRVKERRFVLAPLFELDPELNFPGMGTIRHLLASTEDQSLSVREVSDALLPLLSH